MPKRPFGKPWTRLAGRADLHRGRSRPLEVFLSSQQTSIRRDLLTLWIAIAVVAAVLAALLWVLVRQGAGPQVTRARDLAAVSCEALRAGAIRIDSGPQASGQPAPPSTAAMQAILDMVLRDRPGMEGGFWREAGVVAYAFPTYDGTGVKRDPPSAELDRIASTAQRALDSASLVVDVRPGVREAVVFSACPVNPPAGFTAWTLLRVPLIAAEVVNPLILAVSLLLCLVAVSAVWLSRLLARWQQQSEHLQRQLAQSERLATLGRVSAGLAHEIRNPLGTMRMKVENAMAAPPEVRATRVAGALESVLAQTERLESLVSSLLALTQPFLVRRQPVDLRAFLDDRAGAHGSAAQHSGVRIDVVVASDVAGHDPAPAWFDPVQMARVLDNLLLNALAHARAGGRVQLGADRTAQGGLRLWVADDGPGVPPELRDTLFEPFTTARTGGTGLGLALAREIVQAHGGRIALTDTAQGAHFEIDLPWPVS